MQKREIYGFMSDTTYACFVCGQPAMPNWALIPAEGWGASFPKAQGARAAACQAHHASQPAEPAVVQALTDMADKSALRPPSELLAQTWPWLERLAKAVFWQVFERPWAMPLVLVSGRLGVPPEAEALYQELSAELKEPLLELFPEPGPHKKLDYHFFEMETGREEDSVLWLRLPGGLVVFAYPGEL